MLVTDFTSFLTWTFSFALKTVTLKLWCPLSYFMTSTTKVHSCFVESQTKDFSWKDFFCAKKSNLLSHNPPLLHLRFIISSLSFDVVIIGLFQSDWESTEVPGLFPARPFPAGSLFSRSHCLSEIHLQKQSKSLLSKSKPFLEVKWGLTM